MSERPAPPVESALPARCVTRSATPGSWIVTARRATITSVAPSSRRGARLGSNEQRDDRQRNPCAARPGEHRCDQGDQRDRRARKSSPAVHSLVEAEDECRQEDGRELGRVLTFDGGCTHLGASGKLGADRDQGRGGSRETVGRQDRPRDRRLARDIVGDEQRDHEQLDQRRQLAPARRWILGPHRAGDGPSHEGPSGEGHGGHADRGDPRERIGDCKQGARNPAERAKATDGRKLLYRDQHGQRDQGDERPPDADDGGNRSSDKDRHQRKRVVIDGQGHQ